MKKFYIPTSTLNFINILSSESISPKAFYTQRGFGFHSWTAIPENGLDNAIVLYDNPFEFVRPKNDLEDHPLLIEIDTQEEFIEIRDGVYCCDHTIYLLPHHTKFIFFTEEDKRTTISLSDYSSEVKLMCLYEKYFVTEKYNNKVIQPIDYSVELNKKEIERDYFINKMKGLLYGYYIGVILSTSETFIKKYNILSELHDIFNAVVSSVDRKPAKHQEDKIESLLKELHTTEAYYMILKKSMNDDDIRTYNVIKELGKLYDEMFPVPELSKILISLSGDTRFAKDWLEKIMKKLNEDIVKSRSLLKVSDKEIVIKDLLLTKLSYFTDSQETRIIKAWVNDILIEKMYNHNICSYKKELSDNVTIKVRDIYGEEFWKNSHMRFLLNNMRLLVRKQSNTFQWDNNIVSSIAAVIMKGDDWENLLSFMKRKSMYDYRLAFALYGELHGYANLTRDFTDLLLSESKDYVEEVYREFYRQLFGKDIPANISSWVATEENVVQVSNKNVYNNDFREKIRQIAKSTFRNYKDYDDLLKSVEDTLSLSASSEEFFNKLKHKDLWRTNSGKPNAKWNKLKKNCEGSMSIDNLQKKKEPAYKELSLWNNCSDEIQQASPVSSTDDRIIKENTNIAPKNIIEDDDAYKHIGNCGFLGSNVSKIVLMFKDFQESYRSGHYYKNREKYHRNNYDVIDHFCNWCTSQKNKEALIWNNDNKNMMYKLKQYLLEIYHD